MPIYEFVCEKCNVEFEQLFKRADNGCVVCPECGSKRTRKVFSAFAVSSGGGGDSSSPDCSLCPNSSCASRKE